MPSIFEGILIDQLNSYFEPLLCAQLSGFGKGFSCQTVLTDFIETCKKNLDEKLYAGAILIYAKLLIVCHTVSSFLNY